MRILITLTLTACVSRSHVNACLNEQVRYYNDLCAEADDHVECVVEGARDCVDSR